MGEPGDRLHAKVDGRFVSVLRSLDGKRLYCMDSVCYHMGGPLTVGDIEEVNGRECVKCPWHHYSVTLDTGAKLYQSMEFDAATRKLVPSGWKASEKRQRVHEVEQRGASGAVWVRLTSNDRSAKRHDEAESLPCGSDKWAYKASAAHNVCRPGMSRGGDGKSVKKIRSGDGRYPGARPSPFGGAASGSSGSFRRSGDVLRQARDNAAKLLGGVGVGNRSKSMARVKVKGHEVDKNVSLGNDYLSSSSSAASASQRARKSPLVIMEPTQWSSYALSKRKQITDTMWIFRFALPTLESRLGWDSAERHLKVRALVRGKEIVREYTPVSPLNQRGYFDLAIKVYPDGLMSRHIVDLRIGASLEMCGPFGDVTIGKTLGTVSRSPELTLSAQGGEGDRHVICLTMIAAGSGITPMLQILRQISAHHDIQLPDVDMIYANRTARDIAFGRELSGMASIWRGRNKNFYIQHALSRDTNGSGRICFEMLEQVFKARCGAANYRADGGSKHDNSDGAPKTKAVWLGLGHFGLICGPSDFEESMRTLLVEGFNFQSDHVCVF